MKIRGGDLDLVEYEFVPFQPGENIRTLGLEGEYALSPVTGKVTVRAPARIHLTVLDMNRFAPARPEAAVSVFHGSIAAWKPSASLRGSRSTIPVPG
jgi:hypothetical protein